MQIKTRDSGHWPEVSDLLQVAQVTKSTVIWQSCAILPFHILWSENIPICICLCPVCFCICSLMHILSNIGSDYFKRIAAIGKWNGCYAKCVFYKNQLIHVKMKVGFIRKLTDLGPKVVVAQGLALWVGSTGNSCGCPLLMLDHLWPVQKACLLTNGNWVCVFVCESN